jgi:hypothetical protein
LAGATNLSEIADIQYLQKKLFTALRVPKPFLGFEDVAGDGKNLALQDIRFARTINRIQQSMIQELNKIAIIHLYILGLEDELENFTLALNNPSTQAEMLKIEQTQLKVTLYKELVADSGNGFGAMSMTRAKKEILGMSEEEIRNDLEQQRLEKAAAAEMEQTSNVIKKSGMFDRVDRLYGDFDALTTGAGEAQPEEGGEEGAFGSLESGGSSTTPTPPPTPSTEPTTESTKKKGDLLVEDNKKKYDEKVRRYQGLYLQKLTESLDKSDKIYDLDNVQKESESLNRKINDLTNEIDNLIK